MNFDPAILLARKDLSAAGHGAQVAIVMVNWNGWQDTLAAYESLRRSTFTSWEVICVDNASSDGSLKQLRGSRPQFHLVESNTNLGFASGCNLGIEAACERGASYVYFLNNDATVNKHTLKALVEASKSLDDACALGTVVRYPVSGSLQFWGSQQSREGLPVQFAPSEERLAEAPDLIEADFVLGASLFVPMPVLRRVGNFDDRFFLNFEETDWCYRARRAKHSCYIIKNALIYHKDGASIGDPQGPLQSYFMRRNELLFCEKNVAISTFFKIYIRRTCATLAQLVLSVLPGTSATSAMTHQARALGTLDFTLRRFGDCPPKIRKMAAEYKVLLENAAQREA